MSEFEIKGTPTLEKEINLKIPSLALIFVTHERRDCNFRSVGSNEAKKKSYFIISKLMKYEVFVFSLFKRDVRFIKLL